jgi:hypothetical protein
VTKSRGIGRGESGGAGVHGIILHDRFQQRVQVQTANLMRMLPQESMLRGKSRRRHRPRCGDPVFEMTRLDVGILICGCFAGIVTEGGGEPVHQAPKVIVAHDVGK